MTLSFTLVFGLVFLVLGIVTTYSMYQYWGYPYDKEMRKSECPQWKMNIHRVLGLAYVIVYIVMMVQMVPRLWQYQVEFPARTVAHIILGTTIGFILIIKISILRWFRHFEEWMPALGTIMLLCTVLLTALSVPFYFKEAAIASGTVGQDVFSESNRARVAKLVAEAEFSEGSDLHWIASEDGLRHGRQVLLKQCVYCHDLKTAIDRPRTPGNWVRTVQRMVEKPTLGARLTEADANAVSAYLIAITPDLQKSAKAKRVTEVESEVAQNTLDDLTHEAQDDTPPVEKVTEEVFNPFDGEAEKDLAVPKATKKDKKKIVAKPPVKKKNPIDPKAAKEAFDDECSLCHGLDEVDAAPPKNKKEIDEVLKRMVDNGFEADRKTMRLIRYHMASKYLK